MLQDTGARSHCSPGWTDTELCCAVRRWWQVAQVLAGRPTGAGTTASVMYACDHCITSPSSHHRSDQPHTSLRIQCMETSPPPIILAQYATHTILGVVDYLVGFDQIFTIHDSF